VLTTCVLVSDLMPVPIEPHARKSGIFESVQVIPNLMLVLFATIVSASSRAESVRLCSTGLRVLDFVVETQKRS
jgi:hypothetical protein